MYQEEKQVRLKRKGSRNAIALAMQGRWREAIEANTVILENFPNDVDAYNRLGKAYMELGEYSKAKEAYTKALELDQYNLIARKSLDRLAFLQEESAVVASSQKLEPQDFIEEVGKAKVVRLYSLAPPQVLSPMASGDEVYLKIEGTSLVVENSRGEDLGYVDPKHGQRLIKLMQGGNKYEAAVVSVAPDSISVIIREVYQDPSQAGRLSFPSHAVEEALPYIGERVFKREAEYEEEPAGAGLAEGTAGAEAPAEGLGETEEEKPEFEE